MKSPNFLLRGNEISAAGFQKPKLVRSKSHYDMPRLRVRNYNILTPNSREEYPTEKLEMGWGQKFK